LDLPGFFAVLKKVGYPKVFLKQEKRLIMFAWENAFFCLFVDFLVGFFSDFCTGKLEF
jgi:hypothetical protein